MGVQVSRVEGRGSCWINVGSGVVACLKLGSSNYGSRLQIEEESVMLDCV